MALKITKKSKTPIAPHNATDLLTSEVLTLPERVNENPEVSYSIEVGNIPCQLHLAWNNSDNWKCYTVRCENQFIGYIRTAGGEQVSCRAEVPKCYDLDNENSLKIRMSITACSMKYACHLLLSHAGVLDPSCNNLPKVSLDLSKYNIPF